MSGVTIQQRPGVDGEVLGIGVHLRRIPAMHRATLDEISSLLEDANRLRAAAVRDAETIRMEAREAGYAEGRRVAAVEAAERAVRAQLEARSYVDDGEARLAALAVAIVRRLLPKLDAASQLGTLALEAVAALQAERWLSIRVHPDAVAGVEALRGAMLQEHPTLEQLQVIGDPRLDALDCVAASELGSVRAGIAEQLERIETALIDTARDPSRDTAREHRE